MASANIIREFDNASFTGTPARCDVGKEQAAVFLSRPSGGGPICFLTIVAGDGRHLVDPIDLRTLPGLVDFEDAFGAAPFVSNIDQTIKAFLNYKPSGGGNDRILAIISTGVVPEVSK
jgi:hypothetical protein